MARGIERGDVRLYTFASPGKRRPVVALTRTSAIGMLNMVTVAPVTSAIRGTRSEVVLSADDGMKMSCAVNLHGAITVRQDRLGPRVARLSPERMQQICAALRFALGCDER